MITVNLVLYIIFCHWIFDFIFQTDYMAMNKSKSIKALVSHTALYSVMWFLPMMILLGFHQALIFTAVTFVAHTITDYTTSRWTSKLYEGKAYRSFFNTIGLDQVLHYIQLFLTYLYLL